jgi:phage terminase large subunit-like protein
MVRKDIDPFSFLGERLSLSAGRPNINSYKPHPKQIAFHEACEKCKLYIGGNRSGKTTGGVCEDIWWATGKHPYRTTPEPPIRGRVIGVDFLNGISKIILPEFARWTPLSDLVNGSWEDSYNKEFRTLTFANGSFIEFMSYDQDLDKFAGTSRHFIHFDEEPPEAIYNENQMRLIDTGGSRWITMTPVEGMTWLYDAIYLKGLPEDGSKGDPNIRVIVVDMAENPYINEVEAQFILSGLDEEERAARKSGKIVQIGGLIYNNFNPKTHILESFDVPANWSIFASMDHGLANPTSWHWHTVDPVGRIITFAEYYKAQETVETHALAYHTMNKIIGREPSYNVGDPSIKNRNSQTLTSVQQEYVKHGVFIILGNNDKTAGINRSKSYLKPGPKEGSIPELNGKPMWVMTASCPKLIWEMGRYRRKRWANKKVAQEKNLQEEPIDRDNHALDDCRYFIMSRPDIRILGPSYPALNKIGNVLSLPSVVPVAGRIVQVEPPRHSATNNGINQWDVDEFMGGEW